MTPSSLAEGAAVDRLVREQADQGIKPHELEVEEDDGEGGRLRRSHRAVRLCDEPMAPCRVPLRARDCQPSINSGLSATRIGLGETSPSGRDKRPVYLIGRAQPQ